ncbi:MAG: methyltransferase [Oscillospiraceae bacterium]|nr:methyltransferase [Oscillospiraceae bacterium]
MEYELLSNGMRIVQGPGAFRLSTDSILLADFCTPLRAENIIDLGCGGCSLGVLLCAYNEHCRVTGIEIQIAACEIAAENIRINGIGDRLRVVCADLRAFAEDDPAKFDAVVSNPPYFPVRSGAASQDRTQAIAKTELYCSFDELCLAASRLLTEGGSFYLVHRPERLAELLSTLRAHRLEPKRMRFVRNSQDAPVCMVLIDSRLGAGVGLTVENDLILSHPDGTPTEEYRRIYHIP